MDDEVAKLRAEIAELHDRLRRLDGRARLPTLVQVGQKLQLVYWRIGPGQPAALGDLSAAIEVWDEAYRLLDPDDPARGEVALRLGQLLAARHSTHGGATKDRETGIFVLDEALTFPDLSPTAVGMARLSLAMLHLQRTTEALSPASARAGFLTGLSPGAQDDAVTASRLLREVLAGPPLGAAFTTAARSLLTIAESIQPLLSGDPTRLDLGKMMEALAALQRLQRDGLPSTTWVTGDPLDYPVAVLEGDEDPAPTVPPRRPVRPPDAPVVTGRYSARRAARDRLAALTGGDGSPVWEQARALLSTGPSTLAVGDLDAFVGAAVHAATTGGGDAADGGGAAGGDGAAGGNGGNGEPVERGIDQLLAAIGLCLRESRDGSGWGADDGETTSGAHRAAAAHLRTAVTLVPPDHPAAAVVVEAAGGLVDDTRPLSGAVAGIADVLPGYTAGIPCRPATVTALAELCRTVTALRAGAPVEPDALAAALAAVPTDHPVRGPLAVAVAQARLVAAVHAGGPVTVDPALGRLGGLLDALHHDDRSALRAALDALDHDDRPALDAGPGRVPPPVSAVLGAAHLWLSDDLDTAITLLSGAARTLDDGALRTRTWWRLAGAYRSRGAVGDDERSRDAGRHALRGAGPDRREAARFAGWMLAEGRGAEAFHALETAAAAPGPPTVDPLVLDLLSVLTGVTPPAGPPPEVPDPATVAAAVREVGAVTLLYLHPTDDAGRTAGVLCLDPATERLDVLANVPVTDPLASDDPGWPAVMRRWSPGSFLLAATSGLDRLALPAVRVGDGRRLVQEAVISHVSSGAQVVRLAARSVASVADAPLFVVNPRGDRDHEMAEVMAVRRLCYPRSVCLGRALEPVEGTGTPDDVRKHVSTASMVHLACGLRGTELHLADGEVLDVATVGGAGGLLMLSESTAGPGPALLDAGFVGVVGWRWAVPAPVAALALFLVHLELVEHRRSPAAAVAAVQRWMLDPDRTLPPSLTGSHRNTVTTSDLAGPALWAALTYSGR
ncbi:CHAT domain-containing protein [Micromonospora sp. WMMD987]|uniref:CHAT domain-containing protein n=1 Tax=Micromonospora sp. WMMD987 TaxID=3016089 RepID=UPI00249C7170|nr:CHAT domain-containing protein [Micromonospora sp. WMMD987]WFE95380.1 hypothetical protein O7612_00075 [Micromonospora sp. WMMD987]